MLLLKIVQSTAQCTYEFKNCVRKFGFFGSGPICSWSNCSGTHLYGPPLCPGTHFSGSECYHLSKRSDEALAKSGGALKFAYKNWSSDLVRLQLCEILKEGQQRFMACFVSGSQSFEKSIYSSECFQTYNQDVAKRGKPNIFFAQKPSDLVPVLNTLMQLKRVTDEDCHLIKGEQYRVQKYHGTFLVPLPVTTVLFQKWYRSTGPRYFFKKLFGIFSFCYYLSIDIIKLSLPHFGVELIKF